MDRRRVHPLTSVLICVLLIGEQTVIYGQTPGPEALGSWGDILNWPLQAIHMVLLKNGKVLCVDDANEGNERFTLFDPTPGPGEDSVVVVTPPPDPIGFNDIWCSGHAHLPDGRVAFFGGGADPVHDHTVLFDPDAPVSSPWNVNSDDMPPTGSDPGGPLGRRWYPTATALATGKLLVLSGELAASGPADRPVVLNAAAVATEQYLPSLAESAVKHLPLYPMAFQLSDGRIFVAGSDYFDVKLAPNDPESSVLNIGGTEVPSFAFNPATQEWSANIAYAPIKGGSAVMHRPDRILKAGGALDFDLFASCPWGKFATDRAFNIDLGSPMPEWNELPRMNFRRHDFYLVVLADGKVLAVGGEQRPASPSACPPVLETELWNPDNPTSAWVTMAPMAEPRTYHSTAVLLPDARVLVAGGEDAGPRNTAQIFSPPYLFTSGGAPAARPTINAAPTSIYYGTTFTVESPEAAQVTKISLLKLGAATHSFDHDARFISLDSFSVTGSPPKVTVTAPANGNIAPPGHYMLFILVNGVPSVSKIVRVASCSDVVASTAISASVPAGFLKNRYLSFKPGNPGFTTTCRVTCENLPGAFASFNGTSLYVQEPKEVCEIGGTAVVSGGNCDGNPTFRAATLACTPYPFDWGTINELHVYHELIVPGGQYAVRMGGAGCTSLPSALAISTAPWGDIGSVFDVTCTLTDCWKAPDEVVDVITDVTACLSKFANRAKAPIKARADVEPATLDFKVNISDVTSILGQFRGLPYPFPPPPPSQCPG